jgi:hypothetical protein
MDARYFLIGTDGRQYGPLSQDDVRVWLTDGRASRYSRARRGAEDRWIALREMPEFEEATRPPYLGGGNQPDDAATGGETVESAADASQARTTGLLDPIQCFRQAWALVTRDYVVLAGWTLLVGFIIGMTGLIPRVGWLVGLVINNLLMSGIYLLYLARIRGRRASLQNIVSIVAASSVAVVGAGLAQAALTVVGLVLFILPGIYLAVGYTFVLPLVIDRQMRVWDAMELSRTTVHHQWFQTFALLLALGILLFVSLLAFYVLLVVTLPLCTAALMFAYESLFGDS